MKWLTKISRDVFFQVEHCNNPFQFERRGYCPISSLVLPFWMLSFIPFFLVVYNSFGPHRLRWNCVVVRSVCLWPFQKLNWMPTLEAGASFTDTRKQNTEPKKTNSCHAFMMVRPSNGFYFFSFLCKCVLIFFILCICRLVINKLESFKVLQKILM